MTDNAEAILKAIDVLTDGEGDSVTFCCKNPDFNGLPNECVVVNAMWTGWNDREFRADTREECLTAAIAAMQASICETCGDNPMFCASTPDGCPRSELESEK